LGGTGKEDKKGGALGKRGRKLKGDFQRGMELVKTCQIEQTADFGKLNENA